MKLTKEQALELHRQMWSDMQNSLGDYPWSDEREDYKQEWCEDHFPNEDISFYCFLCEYNDINDFEDGSWVNVTGEITKGDYHGDMPIIKVTEIKSCDKPNDEFVYPPDENYIPTSSWI